VKPASLALLPIPIMGGFQYARYDTGQLIADRVEVDRVL